MKYDAVIFDMDGVLLDSTPAHESAFRKVMGPYGVKNWDYPEIAGMHTETAMRKLFKEAKYEISEEELKACIFKKRKLAFEELSNFTVIGKEIFEVLSALSQRYPLALASSASSRLVQWFVENSKTRGLWKTILSGEDVKQAKPAPEIYLKAAEKLAMTPQNCVVIEDALSGIQSALAAGMDVFVRLGTLSQLPQGEPKVRKGFYQLSELLQIL